ncbi:hypothetical protein L2E82_18286 [Cichorium intybus]|uniref:Uncharacterized protein n=1 Tax=Cichorium intybus TaxID=13427 RepID=A0ACB9F9Y6_CICIN|nr:hypothetical protein L2E82_18286 [Cichorium intybus]
MHTLPRLRCLSLLQQCKSTLPTNHITQIHSQIISNSLTQSPSIVAQLIERYCAPSLPHATNYARLVVTQFYRHHNKHNPYLLNVFIRCAPPTDSILVFANWVSNATLNFDDFTYIFALGACARRARTLWEGLQIHCRVIKHGFLSNIKLQTTLIHFFVNSNAFPFAKKVFDEMPERTAATWNSLITGYSSQTTHARHGLLLFLEMLSGDYGVKPNDTTMVCILSATSRLGSLETGVTIHGYITKTLPDIKNDVYIGTALVDMYAKCGCLNSALKLFKEMSYKNVLTYTTMVSGLAIHGKGKQALKLFTDMTESGILPNSVTFTTLLFACSQSGLVKEGLSLFQIMKEKFYISPLSCHYGCVVDLLGRAGFLNEAFEFIVSEKVEDDEVLWRSLLHSCRVYNDVVMGERVLKIMNVGMYEKSEDFVALCNLRASVGKWEDVVEVREVMNYKGIENKPAVSSVFA